MARTSFSNIKSARDAREFAAAFERRRRGRPVAAAEAATRSRLDGILVFWVSPSRLAQLLQQVGAEEEQRGAHRR